MTAAEARVIYLVGIGIAVVSSATSDLGDPVGLLRAFFGVLVVATPIVSDLL